jgi:Arc/MetJ-type ribon-helix-helix transcriptional regulator
MPKTRRVVFTFDERSLESLKRMTDQGRYPSMANAVKDSLQISRALQNQAEQGYTEIIVRNPETNEERVIVVPNLVTSKNQGGSGE